MDVQFIGAMIPIVLFLATAAVFWKFFDSQSKDRRAMIEKGVNPSEFLASKPHQVKRGDALNNLKWGLLAVFIGIGLITGQQLHDNLGLDEETAIFGCMLISGGIALVLFYFIASSKMKNKE